MLYDRVAVAIALALIVLLWPSQIFSAPVLGGQLFSLGGNVTVEILSDEAGLTSELHLFSTGADRFIATNRDVGLIVDLGNFVAGEELIFGTFVRGPGDTFRMGPGSRNPDGLVHAAVNFIAPGVADVGFEDLLRGGDLDFNDNVFRFRGAIGTAPPPTQAAATFYQFVRNSPPLAACLFATDGRLSPSSPKPCALPADGTLVRDASGTFSPISQPKTPGGAAISLINPTPVLPTNVYHAGEPVFMTLSDGNRNADPAVREIVEVTLTVATGDREILRLKETGTKTGVFSGVILSVPLSDPLIGNNGFLSIASNALITVSYIDPDDPSDTAKAEALVDPFGVVFNSVTGVRINGATVSLISDDTGLPASVFADDGTTSFPSTVISGGTVSTGPPENKTYVFTTGEYRFPFLPPGGYRLVVTPPAGFSAPSAVPLSQLQSNAATSGFKTGIGSFGDRFSVVPGAALNIDIPVDPDELVVTKSTNRVEATAGDSLSYQVAVSNKSQSQGHLYKTAN